MIGPLRYLARRRAERALARGRTDTALRRLRRLAAGRRARPADRLRLAAVLDALGDRAGAIHLLERWAERSAPPAVHQRLAETLIRAGRHADGAAIWARLIESGEISARTMFQLGTAMAERGLAGRAQSLLSDSFQAAEDVHLRREAWRHYAAVAEAAGRHDVALERWQLLAEFAVPTPGDWRHIATLAARVGEADKVQRALHHLADPDDRAAVRQLLAETQRDWAAAFRFAGMRLMWAPPGAAAELYRRRVGYAQHLGDDRQLLRAAFAYRRAEPDAFAADPDCALPAAYALRRLGKRRGVIALLALHRAARLATGDAPSTTGIEADILFAETLLEAGAPGASRAVIDSVASQTPHLAFRIARLSGHLAWAAGDKPRAAGCFHRANATGQGTPATFLREAEAWQAAGATKERSLALRAGLARFPADRALAHHAARFAEEARDWESAAQAWGHAAAHHPSDRIARRRQSIAALEAGRPHVFLALTEDGPEEGAPPPSVEEAPRDASGAGEAAFDLALISAYRQLLEAPETAGAAYCVLANAAADAQQRAAVERFRARCARADAALAAGALGEKDDAAHLATAPGVFGASGGHQRHAGRESGSDQEPDPVPRLDASPGIGLDAGPGLDMGPGLDAGLGLDAGPGLDMGPGLDADRERHTGLQAARDRDADLAGRRYAGGPGRLQTSREADTYAHSLTQEGPCVSSHRPLGQAPEAWALARTAARAAARHAHRPPPVA